MRPSRLAAAAALALAAAWPLAGCSSTRMTIYVDSTPETNGGRPFRAVVRTVEPSAYLTETYATVASKLFTTPPDGSILRSEVIYPGVEKEIELEKPQGNVPLGIYFLFTQPGERWKTTRKAPLPSSVEIELGANEIKKES
jgi:hypothetical protein